MTPQLITIASYNSALYRDPKRFTYFLNNAIERLEPHADKFQVIAFRGSSGAMFAPAIGAALNKHIVHVRKADGHHETGDFTGTLGMGTYLIVDDLVATGDTVRTIQRELHKVSPNSKCVGIYLWSYEELHWRAPHNTNLFVDFAPAPNQHPYNYGLDRPPLPATFRA